jgi:hypothetical protein
MRHRLSIALVLSFLGTFTSIAHAQWPLNGIPVCNDPSTQTNPTIVSDGAGGVIIAWLDGRNGSSSARIYAQRTNAAGTPQWTANGVAVSVLNGNDADPSIASDGAGGAIIAWQHNTPNGVIYAQRLNSSGALQWPTVGPKNGVALTSTGFGRSPILIADGAGGVIAAWPDLRSAVSLDIYAQRVNSTGALLWGASGAAVCIAVNDQTLPALVSDGAGGAIVAWRDERAIFDVYMERLNSTGAPQWGSGSGVLLGSTTNSAEAPGIIADGAGGAIAAWETDAVNHDVITQRVNAAGAPQWGGGALVCTAANVQILPQLVSDGASGAIVTWQDRRTAPDSDVYTQRVNAAGVSQWTANGVLLTNQFAEAPVLASSGSGGALVVWVDTRNVVDHHNIFAHAVTAAGSTGFPADGSPVCTAMADQIRPRIEYSGGNAFVTWQDQRNGGWDIYATMMSVTTGVRDTPPASALALTPNEPNPFNDRTRMNLDLPAEADVKIEVFDVAGRRMRASDLGRMRAGWSEINFDGLDDRGRPFPSGVYFYRVHAGSETVTKKMVIAR